MRRFIVWAHKFLAVVACHIFCTKYCHSFTKQLYMLYINQLQQYYFDFFSKTLMVRVWRRWQDAMP